MAWRCVAYSFLIIVSWMMLSFKALLFAATVFFIFGS
jgi:hypothetical protein